MSRHFQARLITRGRATLGDAIREANPALAAFADTQRRGDRNDRRPNERDRRRFDHAARPMVETPRAPIDPNDREAVERDWTRRVEFARRREIDRRQKQISWRKRQEEENEAKRNAPRGLALEKLAPLGTLAILTASDVPCNLTIAVVREAPQAGRQAAYLDSDLYNALGWFRLGDEETAIEVARFGAHVDVTANDGAWRFRTLFPNGRKRARDQQGREHLWSRADVGHAVLHIRWRTDLLAAWAGHTP